MTTPRWIAGLPGALLTPALGARHRRLMRMLLASAAVVLILGPATGGAGAGTGGETNEDAQMVADAMRTERAIALAYNDKKWDEVRTAYMDDAIFMPPNDEPIRGRDAIVEYISATCTLIFPNRLSPGFSLTPSTGTYGSGGETGTITCLGSLDGHRVTGPGTFGFEGVYTGDCFGNTGSGTYSFTVPTEAGSKHFTGEYSERRTGLHGPIQASQPGGHFQGAFLVLPQKGDCLTSPVTEVVINMAGTFAPSP